MAAVAAVAAAMLSAPLTASAAVTIQASNYKYTPRNQVSVFGQFGFRWANSTAGTEHTATRTGLVSWNFDLTPQALSPTRRIGYAGSYFYFCQFHRFDHDMTGTIRIPVMAFDPPNTGDTTGDTTTSFRVVVAENTAPAGKQYEIQKRKGQSGQWGVWKRTTSNMVTFKAGAAGPGRYYFRSRIRKLSTTSGAPSYSPARSVLVQ